MKKSLILACASAMLLAGCGAGNSTNYVDEPKGGKEETAENVGAAAKKLSSAMAEKKALGLDINGGASASASVAFKKNEALGGLSGKTYSYEAGLNDLKASLALSYGEAFKASASTSANLRLKGTIPTQKIIGGSTLIDIPQYTMEEKAIDINANLSAEAFIEEGVAYVDYSGSKQGIIDIMKVFVPMEGSESSDIPTKIKTALPDQVAGILNELPPYLGQAMSMIAGFLASTAEAAQGSDASWMDSLKNFLSFKSYEGGLYGIKAQANLQNILSTIEGAASTSLPAILKSIDANVEALLVFSETELRSFGASFKVSAKDINPSSLGQQLPVDAAGASMAMIDKISLSSEFGFKANFLYDGAVNVKSVANKESYQELPGAQNIPQLPDFFEEE
jgi:hypothetical protein